MKIEIKEPANKNKSFYELETLEGFECGGCFYIKVGSCAEDGSESALNLETGEVGEMFDGIDVRPRFMELIIGN